MYAIVICLLGECQRYPSIFVGQMDKTEAYYHCNRPIAHLLGNSRSQLFAFDKTSRLYFFIALNIDTSTLMTTNHYQVLIVGGGISGCALLYMLARYSHIDSVALFEKYNHLAPLNSNARGNSQTLHCGDIETNYTLEKAQQVKRIAESVVNYSHIAEDAKPALHVFPKMVLGVGDQEVAYIRQRHDEFAEAFPYMSLWEAKQIAKIEPNVALMNDQIRPEPIIASGCTDRICAVDYGKLSHSFVHNAEKESLSTQVHLNTKVDKIQQTGDHFTITAQGKTYTADYVVVSAGPHSLLFAHRMGYGLEYSVLPIAGSFYFIPKKVNGKVYTVQNDKLPFAAIHVDPDVTEPDLSRLGPTALILPKLERYKPGSIREFLEALKPNSRVVKVFWDLFKDPTIRSYMIKNMLFEVPFVRKRLFLKDAQKIIPSLKLSDLQYARGIGGLRPQVIDRAAGQLKLGAATINPDKAILFNLTPSPGATNCLGNAYLDALEVTRHLGVTFKQDQVVDELFNGQDIR